MLVLFLELELVIVRVWGNLLVILSFFFKCLLLRGELLIGDGVEVV